MDGPTFLSVMVTSIRKSAKRISNPAIASERNYIAIWATESSPTSPWARGQAFSKRPRAAVARSGISIMTVTSNRSGIGARVTCSTGAGHRQMDEVRSGGSYISQNDLRVHFGLGKATRADLEIRWPSGVVDKIAGVAANQVIKVVEGKGVQS